MWGWGVLLSTRNQGCAFVLCLKLPELSPQHVGKLAFTVDKRENAECSFRSGLPQFPSNVAGRAVSVLLSWATEHVSALPRTAEANCEHTNSKKRDEYTLKIKIYPKPDLTLFLKEFSKRKQIKRGG